ncbi:MAG: NAD(P)-dependent oxidoreductase, partial [Deltaproteobacteria bacterium]|nr:NAD(P)-dependent oxidoreductase [Deltaproteobacteria bacterium]
IQAPPKELGDSVKVFMGDVSNITDLLSAIKENKVTQIIHLASLLTATSQQNPVRAFHVNIGGTLNVLESARIMDVKKVVYSSSLAAYGLTPKDQPVPETLPKDPTSVYGATKLFNEHLLSAYNRDADIDFIAVRWPVVWGPSLESQNDGSSYHASGKFTDIVENPARGEEAIFPCGSQEYELLYVKDAAHCLVLALFADGLKHRIFNIGCGCLVRIQELAEMVKQYIPDARIKIEEGFDYFTVPAKGHLDIRLAKDELGYEPEFPPEMAVKDYMGHLGVTS